MSIDPAKIEQALSRISEIDAELATPAVLSNPSASRSLLRERSSLKRLEESLSLYLRLRDELEESRKLAELAGDDPELAALAEADCKRLESELPSAHLAALTALRPVDPADARNALFEIRAGTGGEEAALFAAALFRMYSRYCDERGWKLSVLDASPTELGGYKEVLFMIAADSAYGTFKYESGGHRVQRVPETEAQGRIHTSAATVIVLPEAEEDDNIALPDSELRIDTFCAGGHGGQSVNTTYSAVRITHLPTGLVAQCQDERSQHRNREKALSVLKARILDKQRQEEAARLGKERLDLRGSGDRSQRIRTYNFPQNRLTDHRINLTLYSLDRVMEGHLDPVLQALASHDPER